MFILQTIMSEPCFPLINDSVIVNCFYGAGDRIEGDRPEFMAGRWSARCNYKRIQAGIGNISADVQLIGPICSQTTTDTGMIYKDTINS